jgi:hypothetical protein
MKTPNRRERVEHPGSCEDCTNKICLAAGPNFGKPCAKVETWLSAEEKGSSISWDPETVVLCGDESYMDKLALDHPQGEDPFTLDYYGVESLDDFHISDKQRDAIMMYYFENKRVSQAAKELGISSHAVLERLESAKSRIRKQLNRRLIFDKYLKGLSVEEIYGDTGIKNLYLAKLLTEVYFFDGYPAANVPSRLFSKHHIKTTLGVVYNYVKIVESYLTNEIKDQHKDALTNIYY